MKMVQQQREKPGESMNTKSNHMSFMSRKTEAINRDLTEAGQLVEDTDEEWDAFVERKKSTQLAKKESLVGENAEALSRRKCIIRYNDPIKFYWDVFVIILAVFNCLSIPLTIAFEPEVTQQSWYLIIDFGVDFFFCLDIAVNLSTTYYNVDGDEIFDRKKIAFKYVLGGRFWVDVLSTIPFDDMIPSVKFLKLLGTLKLIRITRLTKIINRLNVKDDIKALIKVGQLIFYLYLFLHGLACFWFFIAK